MLSLDELIAEYVSNAEEHGDATECGNSTRANKCFDNIVKHVKQINAMDDTNERFLALLNHKNDSVRTWAATHALFMNEEMAMKTLQEVKNGEGILSFDASMVIDEWNKGSLESPF